MEADSELILGCVCGGSIGRGSVVFHTVGSGHRICAGGQWHSLSHAPIPGSPVSSVDEVPGCCAGAGFSWTE